MQLSGMTMTTADLSNCLFQAAAHIRKAETFDAICEALVAFATDLGFDRAIVCSISPLAERDLVDEIFFVHGDWSDGRSAKERDAYLLHCPITRHILEFDQPFFWSKTPSVEPGKMTYRIVRGVRDLGQVNGIQIPVFGRTGLEGAVSFAGSALDMSSELRLVAQAVCTLAFHELRRHRSPHARGELQSLTEREREVLRWVAVGRQQSEVASILSISERTVENHLRAVRQRLGASSTAQAVARAMTLGEIEL